MAKTFFFVCGGLFFLTLAAAVAFRPGAAQSGGPTYYAGVGGAAAMVVGRDLYFLSNAYPNAMPYPDPVPGSADISDVHVYNAGYGLPPATTVVLTDGAVYHWSGAVRSWQLMGTFAGPTSATSRSWGSLKTSSR